MFIDSAATALYEPTTRSPDPSTTKMLTRRQAVTVTFTQTFPATVTQTVTFAFESPSSSAETPHPPCQPIALGLGLGLVLPFGLAFIALLLFIWRRSLGDGSGLGDLFPVLRRFGISGIRDGRTSAAEHPLPGQPAPGSLPLRPYPHHEPHLPESHSRSNLIPLEELPQRPLPIPQPPAPVLTGARVDSVDQRAHRGPRGHQLETFV
ncbi:hypothetical protein F5Y12DRAFT_751196 [Xylaria sp. FL1777]|nr:hypothetical protein F5Y12DRAFT_751196 [Xylaria sp. FL1777]